MPAPLRWSLALAMIVQNVQAQTPTARLDSALTVAAPAGGPGAVVMVLKEGRVVYEGARGLADLTAGAPLTATTPIYIASIAKEFT